MSKKSEYELFLETLEDMSLTEVINEFIKAKTGKKIDIEEYLNCGDFIHFSEQIENIIKDLNEEIH